MSSLGLTEEVAAFLAELRPGQIPEGAAEIVRVGFVDCIAVMIAGWEESVSRVVRGTLALTCDDAGGSPFTSIANAPTDLALAYGTAAHALDYDDTALAGHPSAVLVPAVLAEASATGADGGEMIAAYVAGYEVWAELVARDQDPHHQKGWHPSAVFGPIAAASASAVLRHSSVTEARHAIGIAASMAAGIVGNFGSMMKPFQLGRAARAGLEATRLAAAGLTASRDALEHEAGFLQAISPRGRVDRTSPATLGLDWKILRHGLNVKLYPVCYAMHRSLDAMEDLCAEHRFAPGDIAAIEVELGDTQAGILRNHSPTTPLEAKFSIEFGLSAIVVSGCLGMAQLTDGFIKRSDVRDVMARVGVRPLTEKHPDEPQHSPYDRVSVRLLDGRVYTSPRVVYPVGHFRRPVASERLWRKFEECTVSRIGQADARALFDRLSRLDEAQSCSALVCGSDNGK
ncbi:MAG: MmgE/PrpD family protein [Stellaceae bacterium]